jgi:hypothetical protein
MSIFAIPTFEISCGHSEAASFGNAQARVYPVQVGEIRP